MCVINFRISSLASLSPFDRGRFLGQIAALPMNNFAPSLISKQPPLLLLPTSPGPPTISASLRRTANSRKIYRAFQLYRSTRNRVSSKLQCGESACVRARVYRFTVANIYLEFRSFPSPSWGLDR